MKASDIILSLLAVIGATAFIYAYFRANATKDTVQAAKDTIDILNNRIQAQEGKSKEQDMAIYSAEQKIKGLEGELNVVKALPLQQISTDYHKIVDTLNLANENLKKVNEVLESQQKMIGFFYQGYQTGSLPTLDEIRTKNGNGNGK